MNKTNLKIIPNIPLDTLTISDIIERDAKPYHTLNKPEFQDATKTKTGKSKMWNPGVLWNRLEKVL